MSKGLMNSVIHNKGWHGAAILSDKSELGYLYPTPKICAAAHILGICGVQEYAEYAAIGR